MTDTEIPPRPGGPGRPPKYPYKQWFNGELHILEADEHFDVTPRVMSGTLRAAAKRYGLDVTVAVRGEKVYVEAEEAL